MPAARVFYTEQQRRGGWHTGPGPGPPQRAKPGLATSAPRGGSGSRL